MLSTSQTHTGLQKKKKTHLKHRVTSAFGRSICIDEVPMFQRCQIVAKWEPKHVCDDEKRKMREWFIPSEIDCSRRLKANEKKFLNPKYILLHS